MRVAKVRVRQPEHGPILERNKMCEVPKPFARCNDSVPGHTHTAEKHLAHRERNKKIKTNPKKRILPSLVSECPRLDSYAETKPSSLPLCVFIFVCAGCVCACLSVCTTSCNLPSPSLSRSTRSLRFPPCFEDRRWRTSTASSGSRSACCGV